MQNARFTRGAAAVASVLTAFVSAQALALQTGSRELQQPPREAVHPVSTNAPDRPEPGARPGPHQDSSDQAQVIAGDLSAPSASRWMGDILVTDPTYDQVEPTMCKTPNGTLFIAVD